MESTGSGEAIAPKTLQSNLTLHSQAENKAMLSSEESPNAPNPQITKASQPKKSKTKGSEPDAEKSSAKSSNVAKVNGQSSQSQGESATGALPDFVIRRNKLFDELKRRSDAEILEKEHPIINAVLDLGLDKDGKPRPAMPVAAKAWESTPGSFLRHVDKDITSDVVIAKVNGKDLWDLDRPLEYDCRVSYIPFSSAEGRNVFWHSSAHVLGEAAECHYQCLLSHGPPVEQGFFYDMAIGEGYVFGTVQRNPSLMVSSQVVKEADWSPLESKASKYFKEKQPFERLHVSITDLKEMFGYSKYKMYYIENLLPPEGSTVYKCGTLVDLCLGPHIQNTSKIKTFQIMKVGPSPIPCTARLTGDARIPHATLGAIRMMIPCSEYMVLHFLIRNKWWSTRNSLRRHPNVIIERLALTRICFSSMSFLPDLHFCFLMAPSSLMLYKSCCDLSIRSEVIKRFSRQTCTMLNCGRNPVIGSIIKMTCLGSMWRKGNGL